jgi:hypothetical protein
MKYSELLKRAQPKLVAHRVPMPELPELFEEGQEQVFFVSSLTALEKDEMDAALVAYQERNGLTDDQRNEIYRTFCVAYCLCDADNVRSVSPDKVREIDNLVDLVGAMPNNLVRRLWSCVNGANAILGVEDDVVKKFEAAAQSQKNDAGNGDGQAT